MAYIGKQPVVGNFVKLDAITTSATATYNLLNGGVAYFPQTANNCIVSLNGVIQSPTSAYTISGSTIVFDSALTSSDSIDFILVLGDVLAIGTPSDGTVSFAKVTSNLITGATAETSIAGGDSVLIYDDSASALRKMTRTNFVSGLSVTNTPAFFAYHQFVQNFSQNVATKLQFNTELFDTDNAYDNATNYRFLPTTAGKYYISAGAYIDGTSTASPTGLKIYKNGTFYHSAFIYSGGLAGGHHIHNIINLNGSSDYVEIFVESGNSAPFINFAPGSTLSTFFCAYKIIGA
jgi:hypothetical protein